MNEFIQEANQSMMYELAVEMGVVKSHQEWKTKCEAFLQTSDTIKPTTCLQWNKECLQYLTSVPLKPILKRQSAYMVEEIQQGRLTEWERELAEKKADFTNSFQKSIPDAPVFQEGERDVPIAHMEELIAETIAARQYDLESFVPPLPVAPSNKKYIEIGAELVDAKWETTELPALELPGLFSRLKTKTDMEWKEIVEQRLTRLEKACFQEEGAKRRSDSDSDSYFK